MLDHYLSKKWSPDGAGPDHFNCYNLVRDVYGQWGWELPILDITANSLIGSVRAFKRWQSMGIWERIKVPSHGCGVVLRRDLQPIHCGIWLDIDGGGVLHAMGGLDITFMTLNQLTAVDLRSPKFYQFTGENHERKSNS